MNIENLRDLCIALPGVTEEFPFGEETLVYKVMGKIFLLTSLNSDTFRFNVKCEPEKAEELREQYPSVLPGYHMNKKHWNTIVVDGSVPDKVLRSWIVDSYSLVVASLPAKTKQTLDQPPV
ncbi:MmcQ/YjbR family DNA-binding protein [Telluribacter sp.]|jgi:predicted DNA-binding protein (MmcQ/YjbR family)|uniref:MmcQ/YjbR family DNA-binding protein n=1 Tax=Telluribacter sp. TaxID=1978767 RepID=UPI002E157A85|nr:MmcQ/YjbR family DNA-binding protein [Telluribacter sp.]